MIIENAKTIVKNRLTGLGLSFAFVVIIALIAIMGHNNDKYFGHSKFYYALVLGTVYVIYNIYILLLNRNYFNFSDKGDKLEFKYYSTNPFSSKNHFIAIHKNNFQRYELKKSMGLKYDLILYQKSAKGEAKYPPISLSALSADEIQNLTSTLITYTAKA